MQCRCPFETAAAAIGLGSCSSTGWLPRFHREMLRAESSLAGEVLLKAPRSEGTQWQGQGVCPPVKLQFLESTRRNKHPRESKEDK